MEFFRDTATLPGPFPQTVLTIGNFDGVHLGHQMIIREVVARARRRGGTAMLMTFDPPPARVLGKSPVPRITPLTDKATIVASLGIDVFVCETFSIELSVMSPEAFARDILLSCIDPKEILVGYDFCFGRDRAGDAHFLKHFFGPLGVEVYQFSALTSPSGEPGLPDEIVSSSQIRRRIQAGEVDIAARLLGRPFFIRGHVVHGDARGRQIGFPTANIKGDYELVPAHGVYATRFHVDGRAWPSVTNVGRRPTFGGEFVTTEAHLLDFEGDLYGKEVKLEFLERIRGEQKFSGIEALKAQIARDAEAARRLLAGPAVPKAP